MINLLYKIIYPLVVVAEEGYQPLAKGAPISTDQGIEVFLNNWFTVLVGAVGVLAVVWIVIGGLEYMSTDAWTGKTEGKKKIVNALLGLLLAGASYLILYTIDEDLVTIKIGSSINDHQVIRIAYYD